MTFKIAQLERGTGSTLSASKQQAHLSMPQPELLRLRSYFILLPSSLQRIVNTACDILVLEIHSPQWPHKRHLCVLHPPVTFLHNLAAAEASVPSALSSSLFFPPTHHAQAESLHSTCYPIGSFFSSQLSSSKISAQMSFLHSRLP